MLKQELSLESANIVNHRPENICLTVTSVFCDTDQKTPFHQNVIPAVSLIVWIIMKDIIICVHHLCLCEFLEDNSNHDSRWSGKNQCFFYHSRHQKYSIHVTWNCPDETILNLIFETLRWVKICDAGKRDFFFVGILFDIGIYANTIISNATIEFSLIWNLKKSCSTIFFTFVGISHNVDCTITYYWFLCIDICSNSK